MTFKHKLSHRLALLRAAAALALLAGGACTEGEIGSLAPYESMTLAGDRGASISPKSAVIEAGQVLHLKSSSENPEAVKWTASGGTVNPKGTFSSATEGDFLVVSRVSLSGSEKVDTARVRVVRQQANRLLTISPPSAELLPGQTIQFTATATLPSGSPIDAKTNWKASGGEIDRDGNYIAGQIPGSYLLVAFIPSAGVADTVTVTVKPSTRRMVRLLLAPATAAVVAGGVVMYTASAQYEDGSTEPTWASFSASGGSITPTGQEATYTAGSESGAFEVTATTHDGTMQARGTVSVSLEDGGLKDSTVTVLPPLTSPAPATITPSGVLFSDDFSTGDFSRTANGWSWDPASVDIVRGFSKAGNVGNSARFKYTGSSLLTEDAWAELRFKVGTPGLRDLWITYWAYYPIGQESGTVGPKYIHRAGPNGGATNNKFFRLFETYNTGYLQHGGETWNDGQTGDGYLIANRKNGSGITQHYWESKTPWEADSYRGRWLKIEIHNKTASARGVSDGVIQIFRNGTPVVDIRNVDSYPMYGENVWKAGYLLGWANSGFDTTTYTYISNVTFSTVRLP